MPTYGVLFALSALWEQVSTAGRGEITKVELFKMHKNGIGNLAYKWDIYIKFSYFFRKTML